MEEGQEKLGGCIRYVVVMEVKLTTCIVTFVRVSFVGFSFCNIFAQNE